jgi:hypothetical protein
VAPTFDQDSSPVRLLSLWDAGQDLTTAAANRRALEAALVAAQRDYEAALAERSAVLGALAAVQSAYATAHVNAVAVGWSTTELSDAGLPAPQARHSGPRGTERRLVDRTPTGPQPSPSGSRSLPPAGSSQPGPSPLGATPLEATPPPIVRATSRAPAPPPAVEPRRSDERSHWDAEQTAFLVSSRSKDNPVWYESMRQSPISPDGGDADLDGGARPRGGPAGSDDRPGERRP